jgi:L-ascorbate metabolism protein UlaG (beta-lactamase superfamily)
MLSRRNLLIKSIASLGYFVVAGCAKAGGLSFTQNENGSSEFADSPNFNMLTKRFQHPNGDLNDKSFGDLFDFFTDYFRRPDDDWENIGFPVVKNPYDKLQNFRENVMWIGHSSVMVNHSNLTVLTDPQFSDYASPFSFMGPRRATPPPFKISELPPLDVVVISHNHYDHLDEHSIRQISKYQPNVKFLVPLGLKKLLIEWGATDVTELDWWQSVIIKGATFQPTPVQHWSKRSAFDRNKTLWAGWFTQWQDFSFYFAGDTGYSDDFKDVSKRLGRPDLAAIPIGAYEPRKFMKSSHINPEEAVKVFEDLDAKYAIAVHWGTFKLTLEKMDEPPRKLEQALESSGVSKTRFRVLQHGESWPEVFIGAKT